MGGLGTTLLSLEATVTAASASACSNVLPLLPLPTDLPDTWDKIQYGEVKHESTKFYEQTGSSSKFCTARDTAHDGSSERGGRDPRETHFFLFLFFYSFLPLSNPSTFSFLICIILPPLCAGDLRKEVGLLAVY